MEEDLRARLTGDAAIAALVKSSAVAWGDRPQASGLPGITLDYIDDGRPQHMTDFQALRPTQVQVDVWADDKMKARDVRELVIAALVPAASVGATRFNRGFVDRTASSFEGTDTGVVYRERIDFTFWHSAAWPTPFASADFQHGVYTLNGSPAALSDLLIAPRLIVHPVPVLTAGVGWTNIGSGSTAVTGYSATPALLAMMDLTGLGCAMVCDIAVTDLGVGGTNYLELEIGDYPSWTFGWSVGANVPSGGSGNLTPNVQDFFSPTQTATVALPADGNLGLNLSPTSLLALMNGGTPATLTPPDPASLWSGDTFCDILCTVHDVGAQYLVRSIKWYPPQTVARLQSLPL